MSKRVLNVLGDIVVIVLLIIIVAALISIFEYVSLRHQYDICINQCPECVEPQKTIGGK